MMYDGILLKPQLNDLYLKHFNPNHDPKNGQFTSGNGGQIHSSDSNKNKNSRIEDQDLLTEENIYKDKKRSIAAADLGLKALKDIGRNDPYDENVGITGSDREWFLIEDQTIGLPTVADLVNQGKTKQEIKSLIKEAKEASYEHAYEPGYFEFQEGWIGDDFIDSCIKIKKDIDSKVNQAKKSDKWDLNFLESVQNEPYYNDVNKMADEYRKYLLKY